MTDETLGASGLWLGTRTRAGGTASLTESFFWPQPMAPWTTGSEGFKPEHHDIVEDRFYITLRQGFEHKTSGLFLLKIGKRQPPLTADRLT